IASIHSAFSQDADTITARLVRAVRHRHVDILGHCTNRKVTGRSRPPSDFDAEIVFAACAKFDKAVEINCRPERLDPPDELLALAVDWDCKVAIDTDAHAPGQLEWQPFGCEKAAACEVPIESIVNTWAADELTAWAAGHDAR
ncbi:MAG: PHP domain-containing protein, partial [Acidimicrobiales bacterium]